MSINFPNLQSIYNDQMNLLLGSSGLTTKCQFNFGVRKKIYALIVSMILILKNLLTNTRLAGQYHSESAKFALTVTVLDHMEKLLPQKNT
jgi:hypothetical protein